VTGSLWIEVLSQHDRSGKIFFQRAYQDRERPDASGYPQGIPSCEAPLEAQIVAVADVYDAMLSHRPYASARQPDEAREELERVAAKQLDENVVQAFLRVLDGPRHSPSAAL